MHFHYLLFSSCNLSAQSTSQIIECVFPFMAIAFWGSLLFDCSGFSVCGGAEAWTLVLPLRKEERETCNNILYPHLMRSNSMNGL